MIDSVSDCVVINAMLSPLPAMNACQPSTGMNAPRHANEPIMMTGSRIWKVAPRAVRKEILPILSAMGSSFSSSPFMKLSMFFPFLPWTRSVPH